MIRNKKHLYMNEEESAKRFNFERVAAMALGRKENVVMNAYLDGYDKERIAEFMRMNVGQVEDIFATTVRKIKAHPGFKSWQKSQSKRRKNPPGLRLIKG